MLNITNLKKSIYVSKHVLILMWEASKKYTLLGTLFLILAALIPVATAYIVKQIIDLLTASLSQDVLFESLMIWLIAFFIVGILANRAINTWRNSIQVVLGNLMSKHINQKVAAKTSAIPYARFESPQFQNTFERIRDQATWKPLNTFFHIVGAIQQLLIFITGTIVLFAFHPLLVPLMFIFAVPALIVKLKYGEQWWNLIYKETHESRRLNYYQFLLSGHHGMKEVKVLNLKNFLFNRYKKIYDKLFLEQKKTVIQGDTKKFFSLLLSDIVYLLFYVYLTWQTFIGKYSIGDFTFFSSIYMSTSQALTSFMENLANVYENNLFISELIDFFNEPEEDIAKAKYSIPKTIDTLEFKNVWFKYPDTKNWILKGVSFRLNGGKTLAIVGENGAGKTTIVKLITRLYSPNKGSILLNGKDISDYPLEKYRALFGLTFQDYTAFHLSAKENITIGNINKKTTNKQIIHAAKKVQIHDKIMSLPNKYNTTLGKWYNEGTEISQGQWQRIAIARALIKESPLYILDEPTAALDAKAEFLVFKEFKRHVVGKTALFISHRFSNVRLAEQIIVLDKGKIKEIGSHKELLAKKGLYHKLYHFQAASYKE